MIEKIARRLGLPLAALSVAAILLLGFINLTTGQAAPDSVRSVASGGVDAGNCNPGPCATLAYALSQSLPGDTINLAAGVYTEAGVTVNVSVTIQGAGAQNTTIQAAASQSAASDRLMVIDNQAVVSIRDLTLRYGKTSGWGGAVWNNGTLEMLNTRVLTNTSTANGGGGIINFGNLTIHGGMIAGNSGVSGGGIYNSHTLELVNVIVQDNYSEYRGGGIFHLDLNASTAPRLVISGTQILSNTAWSEGGGVYIYDGPALVQGSEISGNDGDSGGGIYTQDLLTVTNSSLLSNRADSSLSDGGAIYAGSGSQIILRQSTLSDNTASGSGAGLYFESGSPGGEVNKYTFDNNDASAQGGAVYLEDGSLSVTNSTFSGNSADDGGAIYLYKGSLKIWNSTLSQNVAWSSAGALYVDSNASGLARNVTMLDNSGEFVAGVRVYGTLTLQNSILSDNDGLAPGGYPSDCSATGVINGTNNLFDEACGAAGWLAPVSFLDETLADNGGPTLTHALLQGSNAIDTGASSCPDLDGNPSSKDQRGQPRPVEGNSDGVTRCDIGAFEAPTYDPIDLVADWIEVTQSVQDLFNSVRLVADKPTFVRFHVHSQSGDYLTGAVLTATNSLGQRVVLSPIDPAGPEIEVQDNPDRSVVDHAFLFELPAGFRRGGIGLHAEVNPLQAKRLRSPAEINYINNDLAIDVAFEPVPELNLVIYRYYYVENNTVQITDPLHVDMLVDWLERAFPTPGVSFESRAIFSLASLLNPGPPTCGQVNTTMFNRKIWDVIFFAGVPLGARYVGLVTDSGSFMRGCAPVPGWSAASPVGTGRFGWDTDGSYADWYGAHELAHAYGRSHAGFCGAKGGGFFPNPSGNISPSSSGFGAIYGFDSGTLQVYPPTWKDLMTYCTNQWISDFTYDNLMTTFQIGPVLQKTGPLEYGAVNRLQVMGTLDASTGEVDLRPLFILPGVNEYRTRTPGPLAIVLKDGSGAELARYPFTPEKMDAAPPARPASVSLAAPQAEESLFMIQEMVPYVNGTAQVEIRGPGDALLKSVSAGAAFPSVTLLGPNGGETLSGPTIQVNWSASDADNDPLRFNLQYSPDNGASWLLVAQGLDSNNVTLNANDIPASNQGRFRIWVTDGIHTSADASNGPFTVSNHLPQARIVRPGHDLTVALSQTVQLKGRAFDADLRLQENPAPGSGLTLTWSSSLQGILSSDEFFSFANLELGQHEITFQARDPQGAVATDTVKILVVPDPQSLPGKPDWLRASQKVLSFDPSGASQLNLHLVNNNRRRPHIAWQLTGSPPAWLSVSTLVNASDSPLPASTGSEPQSTSPETPALSGQTPTNLQLNYQDIGLPSGTYTGTLTFTSPVVPTQTLVIPLSLYIPDWQVYLPLMQR